MKKFSAGVIITLLFLLCALKANGQERCTGYKAPTPEKRALLNQKAKAANGGRIAQHMKTQSLPSAFDCRTKNWVMPTGDQGSCGSCYLYSTIYYNLTSAFIKVGYGKADGSFVMAVQYGMDCHDFGDCGGGWGVEVIDWACKNGWYAEKWVDVDGKAHADYPSYEARSRACRPVQGAKKWVPAGWGYCASDGSDRQPTTEEIKTAMFNYGVLNVAIDAGGQFGNGTETITSLGRNIDHEIACVAWDDAKDGGAFLLHNQWSEDWGNGGFRWVTYAAAKNIVDWFWVTATALPPPPPPPPPPDGIQITSPLTAQGVVGMPFSYQIAASHDPVFLGAFGLPSGLTCSSAGLIAGSPSEAGITSVVLVAANKSAAATATLALTVSATPPPPSNVSIKLTPEQVKSVIDQAASESGFVVVTEKMTIQQIVEAMAKNKAKPCCEPKMPQAPKETPEPPMKKAGADDYTTKYALALKEKKPLVVFVGVPVFDVEGAYTCRKEWWPDFRRGIMIALPADGDMWYTTLQGQPSAEDIKKEIARRKS